MSENNKTNSCIEESSNVFNEILRYIAVALITILFVFPIWFFCIQTTTEAHNDHGLKTNEKMIAAIDSLESNSIALDSVQLRQEIMQVKKLTKYLVERESNYQMEIDMIIDKYSQWTGYWLSIISIVLTIFTIIQALLNHRMNNENDKKNREVMKEMKGIKSDYEKQKKDVAYYIEESDKKIETNYKQKENEFDKSCDDIYKKFKSSIHHNNLSCISACLGTFPDAFSFSPNEERKKFIKTFMEMLCAEYFEFTKDVFKMTDRICKEETNMKSDFSEEIRYIYLAWCDISIAINKASLDYTETRQIVAFEELKESLSTAIIMYHNGCVVSTNVAEYIFILVDLLSGYRGA